MTRLLAIWLLVWPCAIMSAQGVRLDPDYGNIASPFPGASRPLVTAPGATVTLCNNNSLPCNSLAATYTDATLNTACPLTPVAKQVTIPGTSVCGSTSDLTTGKFGWWVAAGNYFWYWFPPGGVTTQGPFPITAPSTTSGTVMGVSATPPISSSGGATPNISISQSGASTNGYLSSTDWNTFNGKQGQVTATPPLQRTGDAISITQSGTATDGYLSSTDWNIFNNKQGAITFPITVAQGGTNGTTATDAQNNLDFLSSLTGASARSYRDKYSDYVNLKDFGAACDNTTNDAGAIAAAESSSVDGVNIPFGQTCLTLGGFTPTKVYLGQGRVNNSGYLQARSLINVSTKPSQGNVWSIANGQLTNIVVSGGVATAHLTVSPSPQPALIQIYGAETSQALNTTAVAILSNPTSSSFTFNTAAADGTYTDASIIVQDRSNVSYGGDTTRQLSSEQYTIASTVARGGIGDFYYDYTLMPHYGQEIINSGFSGTNAVTTAPLSIGDTVIPVNSTANLSVGQVVDVDNTNTETRTIVSKTSGSITVNLPLAHTHTTTAGIGSEARTMSPYYNVDQFVGATGGGDNYAYLANETCGVTPQAGQIVAFIVATCGIFGGATSAAADDNYLQASEVSLNDNGFDTFVVADVRSLTRTNDTAAHNQEWIGSYIQSNGTKRVDAIAAWGGNAKVGLDLTRLIMDSDERAIQMCANCRTYYDVGTTPAGSNILSIFPLYGNTINSQTYSFYDLADTAYKWVTHGTTALTMDSANAIFSVNIGAGATISSQPQVGAGIGTCNSGKAGTIAFVTDSTTQVWGATYTGAGALTARVSCNGTDWTVYAK